MKRFALEIAIFKAALYILWQRITRRHKVKSGTLFGYPIIEVDSLPPVDMQLGDFSWYAGIDKGPK